MLPIFYVVIYCLTMSGLIDVIICLPTTSASIDFFKNERTEDGYHFEFQSSDQIHREETGRFEQTPNDENGNLNVMGSYSYFYKNVLYSVYYTSGENGFRIIKMTFGAQKPVVPGEAAPSSGPPAPAAEPPSVNISSDCLGSLCGGNTLG